MSPDADWRTATEHACFYLNGANAKVWIAAMCIRFGIWAMTSNELAQTLVKDHLSTVVPLNVTCRRVFQDVPGPILGEAACRTLYEESPKSILRLNVSIVSSWKL